MTTRRTILQALALSVPEMNLGQLLVQEPLPEAGTEFLDLAGIPIEIHFLTASARILALGLSTDASNGVLEFEVVKTGTLSSVSFTRTDTGDVLLREPGDSFLQSKQLVGSGHTTLIFKREPLENAYRRMKIRYLDVPELRELCVKDGDVLEMTSQDATVLTANLLDRIASATHWADAETENYRVCNVTPEGFDLEKLDD